MAWETRRGSSSRYYYRVKRRNGLVRKEYVGGEASPVARLAAELDGLERELREQEEADAKFELDRLEACVAPLLGLDEAAEVLTRAHLVANGYRRVNGVWRRRRG